jgi:hypothetical protein
MHFKITIFMTTQQIMTSLMMSLYGFQHDIPYLSNIQHSRQIQILFQHDNYKK